MKKLILVVLLGFVPWLLVTAKAQDLAAGEAGYAVCVSCHGASDEGNVALNSPGLTGQDATYLVRQLKNFKAGVRGSDTSDMFGAHMRAMAGSLVDDAAIDFLWHPVIVAPITCLHMENRDLHALGNNCR